MKLLHIKGKPENLIQGRKFYFNQFYSSVGKAPLVDGEDVGFVKNENDEWVASYCGSTFVVGCKGCKSIGKILSEYLFFDPFDVKEVASPPSSTVH